MYVDKIIYIFILTDTSKNIEDTRTNGIIDVQLKAGILDVNEPQNSNDLTVEKTLIDDQNINSVR